MLWRIGGVGGPETFDRYLRTYYAQPRAPGSASNPYQHPTEVAFATSLHPTIIASDPHTKQDSDEERTASSMPGQIPHSVYVQ